jgi:hypothetical protein
MSHIPEHEIFPEWQNQFLYLQGKIVNAIFFYNVNKK